MENSKNYGSLLEAGMRKKKRKDWQSMEGKPDASFLRDMGYGSKDKKKKKK